MTKTQSNLQANSTNIVHSERDLLDKFDTKPLTQKIKLHRSIPTASFGIKESSKNCL